MRSRSVKVHVERSVGTDERGDTVYRFKATVTPAPKVAEDLQRYGLTRLSYSGASTVATAELTDGQWVLDVESSYLPMVIEADEGLQAAIYTMLKKLAVAESFAHHTVQDYTIGESGSRSG